MANTVTIKYFYNILIYVFILVMAVFTLASSQRNSNDGVFRCGQRMNKTHGYISTPNFPGRFSVPLSCKWIFYAPPGKKVVLYFTQYYIRDFFYITEYDYYQDESVYVGRTDLGEMRLFEKQVIYLQGFKPYLVVDFRVAEMGNINIRVDDFLLDVYGFNITYEIMDSEKTIRNDVCSVYTCSFLGNCFASRNFRTYSCHCFNGYYGDECQYGPSCDPELGQNVCQNGGKCRYFWGSLVNICECPTGFHGLYCELKKPGVLNSECEALGCTQKCIKHHNKMSECACEEGFKLQKDNKTCIERGMVRYNCLIRMIDDGHRKPLPSCEIEEQVKIEISVLSTFLKEEFYNTTVDEVRSENGYRYYSIEFLGEKYGEAQFIMQWLIYNSSVCGFHFDPVYLDFKSELALHALTVEIYNTDKVTEGGSLTLMCKIKGSEEVNFVWLKEGSLVHAHMAARNMWETRIPNTDGETHISVLTIDGVMLIDEGTFTCQVSDSTETQEKSIFVTVTRKPTVEITPMTASYHQNDDITILCASYDDANADYNYHWLINGKPVIPGEIRPNAEVIEDIFPTGSRVKIANLKEGANYTCSVALGSDRTISNTSIISVIKNNQYCKSDKFLDVIWNQTNGSAYDLHTCPQNTLGMARRKCICSGSKNCTWMYPDLSNCTSINATEIHQKVQVVTLGYAQYDLEDILQETSQYLNALAQLNSITLIGDLNILSYNLWKLQEFKARYRLDSSESFSLKKLIKVSEEILDFVSQLNEDQKQLIAVMPYLIKMLDNIKKVELRSQFSSTGKGKYLEIAAKEGHVKNITNSFVHLYHKEAIVAVQLPTIKSASDFYNLNIISVAYDHRKYHRTILGNRETFLNSKAIHVNIFKDDPPFTQHLPMNFSITYFHTKKQVKPNRQDFCAVWKFTNFPKGEWHESACVVTVSTIAQTVCQCTWSGLHALFSTYNASRKVETKPFLLGKMPEIILLVPAIGFALCIFVNIFLIFWKSNDRSTYLMLLNLCTSMTCLSVSLFIGELKTTIQKEVCSTNICLVQTFYIAAIMSMTANVVIEIVKSSVKDNRLIFTVFISVAWGLPVTFFIICITNGTSETREEPLSCLPIQNDTIFLCSIAIGTVISFILCAIHTVYTYQSVQHEKEYKVHHLFLLLRCFLTVILLLGVILTVMFKDQLPYLSLETTSLTLVLLLWLPVSHFMKILQTKCQGQVNYWTSRCYFFRIQRRNSTASSTFKAFVRPETMTSLKTQCSDSFNNVYIRDQKFTRDKKAQLSSLLGTSSSEDSGEVFSIPTRLSAENFNGYGTYLNDIEDVPLKPEKGKCYILDSNIDA